MMTKLLIVALLILPVISCRTTGSPEELNLSSTRDVTDLLATKTSDGELDLADIKALFVAAGDWVNSGEGLAIFNAIFHPSPSYKVSPETIAAAKEWALYRDLSASEIKQIKSRKTYAGDPIPDAVIEVLSRAKLSGAIAYDVNYSEAGEDEPRFNPHYSSTPVATDNMTWKYTQVVPGGLEADLAFKGESTWMKRIENVGGGRTWTYTKKPGGTGLIVGTYDEVNHPDIFARTTSGAKWAHNCGILSDGSFHCLPAARRNINEIEAMNDPSIASYILVNPDLSRNNRMMYTGHIEARRGVINDIEVSGKISKLAGKSKNVFVNPLCLLKAWGYTDAQINSARLYFDSKGDPERVPTLHAETCTLREHR